MKNKKSTQLRTSNINPLERQLAVGSVIQTSYGGKYKILEKIGTGGRGQAYKALVLTKPDKSGWPVPRTFTKGSFVVIKTVRIDWQRTGEDTKRFIKLVNSTFETEISVLTLMRDLKCAAKTLDSGLLQIQLKDGTAVSPRFIVQEFIEGKSLPKYLRDNHSNKFSGISSARDWFRMAERIVWTVKEVHQRGVYHKDIWPDNFMMRNNKPILIDFGESAFRQDAFIGNDSVLLNPHEYLAPEFRNQKRFPSRRADLYSIGGVLFYLATGQRPPLNSDKDNDVHKQDITNAIKKINPKLVQDNVGIPDIIARCLRYDLNDRVPNTQDLLEEIGAFQNRKSTSPVKDLKRVEKMSQQLVQPEFDFFARMAVMDIRKLKNRIQDMSKGYLDISGDHETIVSGLTQYLSVLQRGDQYLTVSVPEFWTEDNLGLNGRYLAMNRVIAERGVIVKRVFLLTKHDLVNDEVLKVLDTHLSLKKELAPKKAAFLDLSFILVKPKEKKNAIYDGHHCGLWIRKQGCMKIIPVYDKNPADKNKTIRSIRFRKPDEGPESLVERFEQKYLAKSKALELHIQIK